MKITKDQKRYLYFYLKKFYKCHPKEKYNIFHFVKFFKKRLRNPRKYPSMSGKNKDAWIPVCGPTSTGKSYLGIMIGMLFNRPYDLSKNITYKPK